MIDLRQGKYQEVLGDVATVDAVIFDPPYGKRVHDGHDAAADQVRSATGQKTRRNLTYSFWTPEDVHEVVELWAPRCTGWMLALTSDDLIEAWRAAYRKAGRYDFAPVPVLIYHPRLLGDGPGSGAVYAMASRPRTRAAMRWRSLPPWYGPYYPAASKGYIGGKPIELMRSLIEDYTNPGQTICDPCAGWGTTLVAAHQMGRSAVGAEVDPTTYQKAKNWLGAALRSQPLFVSAAPGQSISLGLDTD